MLLRLVGAAFAAAICAIDVPLSLADHRYWFALGEAAFCVLNLWIVWRNLPPKDDPSLASGDSLTKLALDWYDVQRRWYEIGRFGDALLRQRLKRLLTQELDRAAAAYGLRRLYPGGMEEDDQDEKLGCAPSSAGCDAYVGGMTPLLLLLALVVTGLLVYAFAQANLKAAEIGRLLFACALLVLLFLLAGEMPRLLR